MNRPPSVSCQRRYFFPPFPSIHLVKALSLRHVAGSISFLSVLLILSVVAGHTQEFPFTLDFEEGTLNGWTSTGNAFATQPTYGDNPTARRRGQPANHQGRYWIGTYENYRVPGRQQAGMIQGDEPRGTLVSAPFIIPKGRLNFLVGGGSGFETRVELLLAPPAARRSAGGEAVLWASGRNTETMHRVEWDLTPHAGKSGRLRIVDNASGGWGHINVDDFRFIASLSTPDRLPEEPPAVQTVLVPALEKRTLQEAAALLARRGLKVGQRREMATSGLPGTVIDQRPGPGTRVLAGSAVALVISVERRVTVPDLGGKSRHLALESLRKAELLPGEEAKTASIRPEGTILDQKPRPGETVLAGSTVDLNVSGGPVTVPSLLALSRGQAEQSLQRATLLVGKISTRKSTAAGETVIEQEPAPGTWVPSGTRVDLVFARTSPPAEPDRTDHPPARRQGIPGVEAPGEGEGPTDTGAAPPAIVPNLLGQTRQEAYGIILDHRLAVGTVEERSSSREADTVIEQKPGPGRQVPAGSMVDLVIAQKPAVALGWEHIAIALLLVFGAGYFLASRRKPGKANPETTPVVMAAPHLDFGIQEMALKTAVVESVLRLQPKRDAGVQSVVCESDLTPEGGKET